MPIGRKRSLSHDANTNGADSSAKRQKAAPQAAPHKRGGTHRVKDQDRTHTHWDENNYAELKYAIKSRPGLYIKDMKKVDIAKALAADDKAEKIKEKKQERESDLKRAKLKKKRDKQKQEKDCERKRLMDKKAIREAREQAGEGNISDATDDDDIIRDHAMLEDEIYDTGIAGDILSDDSKKTESSSEAPTSASISPIFPYQRLRIFEWPYTSMPPHVLPKPLVNFASRQHAPEATKEVFPRKIAYAIMNLITTYTKEKLELPGRTYPDPVEPDFAPKISQHTIDCVRNGVMTSSLRKAVIERGADWAKRTRLQGWNARMFLFLPPRSSNVSLRDVYAKWNNKPAAQSVRARNPHSGKVGKTRPKQTPREKREKLLDVFASSDWRPPICYLPAYLEYSEPREVLEGANDVGNLYYVRFPGMDLPHFYFWTYEGDWADPTIPNPEWLDAKVQDEEDERQEAVRHEEIAEKDRRKKTDISHDVARPHAVLDESKIRVKKPTVPRKFQPSQKQPKASSYKTALANMEKDLYQDGLTATLYKYRTRWLTEGKQQHWEHLSANLPRLYPSGKLPNLPPVHSSQYPSKCLAEKLAAIQIPSHSRTVAPIQGDEPWTRDDDAYWNTIDILDEAVPEAEVPIELTRPIEPLDTSPLYILHIDSHSPKFPAGKPVRTFERHMWERLFEEQAKLAASGRNVQRESSMTAKSDMETISTFEIKAMPTTELKRQLHSPMKDPPKHDQDRMTSFELQKRGGDAVAMHGQEAATQCPFCGMEWALLDPRARSTHVFSHGVDSSRHQRRSNPTPSLSTTLYGFPNVVRRVNRRLAAMNNQSSPRKTSTVSFSPQIVETRGACYDSRDDGGIDADANSIAAATTRRRSMRGKAWYGANKTTKRVDLRIDTGAKTGKRNGEEEDENASKKGITTRSSAGSTPHPAKWPSSILSDAVRGKADAKPQMKKEVSNLGLRFVG